MPNARAKTEKSNILITSESIFVNVDFNIIILQVPELSIYSFDFEIVFRL